MTTLNQIRPGGQCRVRKVNGTEAISQRLMEMGLVCGSMVEVVRLAPMGDPMEIEVQGYHLSLRKSEAALVEVDPWPSP